MKFLITLLILIGLVTAITQWRAATREARFQARFPPLGQFVDIDGTRVHALVRGAGPDLVLIHGSSGNLRDFDFQILDQLAQTYRVIAFDRPGMGYTDRLGYGRETIADQAHLLQRAAAALGAEAPIVLGQSYGGAVALAWAVKQPETLSALVLVAAPTQPWNGEIPGLYRLNGSALGSLLAVPLITAFVSENYIQRQIEAVFVPDPMPAGYGDHVGAELAVRRTSLRANAHHRVNLLEQITDLQPAYGALTLPIELIHSDADTTVGLDIHATPFVAQVPSAQLTRLPGAGHLPHHTRTDDMIAAIERAASRAGLR